MAEVPAAVRELLGDLDGGMVLELGCGDGEFTETLVEQLAGFDEILATDADPGLLDEARGYFAAAHPDAPVRFLHADAASLPFENGRFDTVVLSNAIHHLSAPRAALTEAARVLRAEGHIVIHEMIADCKEAKQRVGRDLHHLKARVDRTQGISHNPTLSRSELMGLLREAGLSVIRQTEYDRDRVTDAEIDLEDKLDNIDAYADHAAGHPDYPGIRREVSRLRHQVRTHGFAEAPQLLVVTVPRKRAAPDGTGRST
jgi:SAM-dependent methyltransferase